MQSITDLDHHGLLHTVSVPLTRCDFRGIQMICDKTPCHAAFLDVTSHLNGDERALIDQSGGNTKRILVTKNPDSLLFTDQNKRFLSILHSEKLYGEPHNETGTLVCQVAIPGNPPPQPFFVSSEHKVTPHNVISRMAPFKHVYAQINSIQKLDGQPKELFSSDSLGKFSGKMITGPDAALLKHALLGLHDHFATNAEGGEGVYNRNIKLLPELSELLMLKNPDGDINLERLPDGILGYRPRQSDNGNTFLFVANSDDFHKSKMSSPDESRVQVFKMDYNVKGKQKHQARISWVAHPNDINNLSDEVKENGVVHSKMTVQDILNTISHAYMKKELERIGCEHFPQYIQCCNGNAGVN